MEKEEALGWRGEMERCCIQTSSTHSLTTPFALIVLAQLTRPTHFQLKRKKERKKKKRKKKRHKKRKNRLVFTILTVARAQSYQKENKTRKLIARIKIRRVPILAQKKEKEKEIINE